MSALKSPSCPGLTDDKVIIRKTPPRHSTLGDTEQHDHHIRSQEFRADEYDPAGGFERSNSQVSRPVRRRNLGVDLQRQSDGEDETLD